jgi:RimJ/RimL family protein N-acetyltransferase
MPASQSCPQIEPVTLQGATVRLELLQTHHLAGLCEVGLYPELWIWIPNPLRTRDDMAAYVAIALDQYRSGNALPFVIVDRLSSMIIGSTRYANIDVGNRRLEIGWTWLTPAWQRTAANTEAKLLLLSHAFESLGMNRVELKTDALNEKSRRAIVRLGAVEEGTFRRNVVTASGRVRDTVYYSILATEWPKIRERMVNRLDGKSRQP